MRPEDALNVFRDLIALGGPVVAALVILSVGALAVAIWKFVQFTRLRVGRHDQLRLALEAWDRGDLPNAEAACKRSRSHLAVVVEMVIRSSGQLGNAAFRNRVETAAGARLDHAERGLRLLDSIAQVAPLLGLFGTVLGMIDAFQALQDAGASVDPSILAGGIWVALLTTAVGLGVAMPTTLILAWFEGQLDRDRAFAERTISRLFYPFPEAAADPDCAPAGSFGYAAQS
ncbi:MAG: MotA/TolQ/ExbB proton channel family protein [Pseudomonadota bacterium]